MSNNKLGSYITKLMSTIVDKEQEEFVKNLALSELTSIKNSMEEFIMKNTIKKENFPEEDTEKELLQEKKNDKKNKQSS
tara:strand:- start:37 stop:273 length:237 start_codon:yes stop_codon:yes gene_type:complete